MSNQAGNVDLLELNATQLQKLLSTQELTSVTLVKLLLAQISRHDRAGLRLNAMISVAPEDLLLAKAAKLDEEREHGHFRRPLHGIPIIVKDAINTHSDLGLATTVGSYALADSRPAKSAKVVERLIEQGVIIIGKSNLNEFCNFKGEATTNGWSAVGGQTISAYVEGGIKRDDGPMGHSNPCGSSTGSAVGVSAGYSPIALGTETDGSLVQPASRAALYVLKPTVGAVHTKGIWTLSKTFDVVGAMAKSVVDVATVTECLLKDSARQSLPKDGFTSFLAGSFKDLRIGFLSPEEWHFPAKMQKQVKSATEQMRDTYIDAIRRIKEAGAHVQYPISIPTVSDLSIDGEDAINTVIYENNIKEYLAALDYSKVHNLKDIIEFNTNHAAKELPEGFPDQSRLLKASTDPPSAQAAERAKAHCRATAREKGVARAFQEQNLDLLAMPMDSPIPSISAAAGYPLATMPLGTLDFNGRPFGLALMGKPGREDLMIQFMSAFERVFPKREVPLLLKRWGQQEDARL